MTPVLDRNDDRLDAQVRHVPLASGREAIIWHWPASGERVGSIAFSHGSHSAPWKYDRLILPWRAAGYDVWAPLHVDSVDHPSTSDYPGPETWRARLEDMRAVSRLIGAPYVAAGHSYGALTALVMGGVQARIPEGMEAPLRDPLADCVVALSPPPPYPGLITLEGFQGIEVPALIQTGDRDLMPGWPETHDGWRVHLPAYEQAAPGGDRYLLVLAGVDHYFGSAIGEPDRDEPPQLDALTRAVGITQLFLQAYHPEHDADARSLLDSLLTASGRARFEKK